jgi:hypothetical protein
MEIRRYKGKVYEYEGYEYDRPGFKSGRAPKGKKKLVSRQRVYQLRMKRRGKCIKCGRRRERLSETCNRCTAKLVMVPSRAKLAREFPGVIEA